MDVNISVTFTTSLNSALGFAYLTVDTVFVASWVIPPEADFAGNNITQRSSSGHSGQTGKSYVDLNIELRPGILQKFQYYVSNPYNTIQSQRIWFQVWSVKEQLFHGGTNALLNTSLELVHQSSAMLNTRTGAHEVNCVTESSP